MDIDDDMMDAIPNNQPYFGCLWSTSVRLVGEVAGLYGWEQHTKGAHPKMNKSWTFGGGGGMQQSTIETNSTAGGISLSPNTKIHHFE
jgi:hypothetical protein